MAQDKLDKMIHKEEFMTEEEVTRINDYIGKLNDVKGDMQDLYSEWSDIEKYYQNNQDEIEGVPNSKINVLNANIEGQAAMVIEQNLAISTRGESAGDEEYAEDARIGLDWTLRKNYFKNVLRGFIRRFLKFGTGVFSLYFDRDALDKIGLVKIFPTPLTKIFIDGKIKDPLRVQEAEFVAEAITLSKSQFKDIYGEDKASAISYGTFPIDDNSVFDVTEGAGDEEAATLVRLWSRQKGKLRLEEFSGCGTLLYDSHKAGGRKDNQKNKDARIKSYYKFVKDKYPYFIAGLYAREGNLFGFGDGKLILPLQKLLNELYDKIRICARPNLILYDTNADMSLDDFDENSLMPRPYDGTQSNNPVQTVPWGVINEAWWRLLNNIHDEIQRVTRFSGLMMGQSKAADTATEASIQHQQGNMATDDKKKIIETTITEMLEYALGLMMEFYTEGRSFRVDAEEKKYKWVDFRSMTNVPVKIPATNEFVNDYRNRNPEAEIPVWQLLTGNDGMPLTKNVDLDIEVNIGAGLPKNKAFITKFVQDLSGVQLVDQTGQPKPAVFWEEMREFLKNYVGLPIRDIDSMMQQMPMMPDQQQQMQPESPPMNPNVEGLAQNGMPQMGGLAEIRGGLTGGVPLG